MGEKNKKEQQRKQQLLRDLRSKDPQVVQRAIEEMRKQGWLTDDTLEKANLSSINLSTLDLSFANLSFVWLAETNLKSVDLRGATLIGANLQRANLEGANLQNTQLIATNFGRANLQGASLQMSNLLGADMRNANLSEVKLYQANLQGTKLVETNLKGSSIGDYQFLYACDLMEATMPDGSRYDGRFNLEGDVERAQFNGIDIENDEEMAKWYSVTVEQYREGQFWFTQNQGRLRAEWKKIVEKHHGPKKELRGLCGPTKTEKDVIDQVRQILIPPEAEVKPIVVDPNKRLRPLPDIDDIG